MHPFSESMGSAVRVKELSLSLSRVGVEIYIFTPYERSFELFPNVHVISIGGFTNSLEFSKVLYKFSKFLYYSNVFPNLFSQFGQQSKILAMFVRSLHKSIVSCGADIIQIEQDAVLPIGIYLKEKTGLPLIADIHNISSEELIANGVINKSSSKFLELQLTTKTYLSQADHVVVVSKSMKDYVIANYGLSQRNVSVVPPGGRVATRESLKTPTVPAKAVYAGLVASREHVDLFVNSIPHVVKCNSEVQFYITNKGEAVKTIKQLSKKINVKPIFFWFDNYVDVNIFLSSCDIGVLPSSNDIARQMGTPAKLFTYLSTGLPIVANNIGGWTEIINREKVGLLTSDDPTEFGDAILNLINDPKKMSEYRHNGLELIKRQFNWDYSALMLMTVYEGLRYS